MKFLMTVLFDIGNVLIKVNIDSFYNRVFGTADPDPQIIAKFIEIRDLHDRGNLDQTSFITQIRDLSPLDVSPRLRLLFSGPLLSSLTEQMPLCETW